MSQPAARITDMHTCPLSDGPKPHVGGPVTGPSVTNVLIGSLPAAVVGDMCTCTGPPDMIAIGSTNVLIAGKPAARMGDSTAHGGVIVGGCPNVLIGSNASSSNASSKNIVGKKQNSQPTSDTIIKQTNSDNLKKAAETSERIAERKTKQNYSAQYTLLDNNNQPIAGVNYQIKMNDGTIYKGRTDQSGKTTAIQGYTVGDGTIIFEQ